MAAQMGLGSIPATRGMEMSSIRKEFNGFFSGLPVVTGPIHLR